MQSGLALNPSFRLTIGVVIDVLAGPRQYTVLLPSKLRIPCSVLPQIGSSALLGAKQIGLYSTGTTVLVAVPRLTGYSMTHRTITQTSGSHGYILGALAEEMANSVLRCCDNITHFNGTDALNDPTQQYLMADNNLFRDYNAGQPFDAVAGSDEGMVNELGVGQGIGRWFAWVRASDVAGLWCFYLDNLTRLAAYNYEFWTSGGERWIKNDEGEVNDVDMFTPYPWEAAGLAIPYVEPFDTTVDGGVVRANQFNFPYEPQFQDQTMLPRWLKLRGYIGDVHREMVVLPRPDFSTVKPTEFVERTTLKTNYTGLLDVHQHSNGLYSVRSAQGIVHEKTLFIPVPKQTAYPEDADWRPEDRPEGPVVPIGGDGATNYQPAGVWGDGSPYGLNSLHYKDPWPWTKPTRADMWAAEYFDYSAFMFNWYGYKPLLAHQNDWYLLDSGFFANEDPVAGAFIPVKTLGDAFLADLPTYTSIKVDHRRGETKYYYSRSVIAQLPDGSILIEDGYGSSIHMVGGSMHLTCMGDLWARPGRCMNIWAGDDLIARAGSSVDITSSNADVRIKSERNLHMLAGNSGVQGGVLIESRSVYGVGGAFIYKDVVGEDVGSYGVTIKTPGSPIMFYGRDIYGRALSFSEGGGDVIGGNVELECDEGLITSAKEQLHYAKGGITQILGQIISDGGVISGSSIVNRFDTDNAVFGATKLFRSPAATVVLDSPNGLYTTGMIATKGGLVPFQGDTTAVIDGFINDYRTWMLGPLATLTDYYYKDMYTVIKSNGEFMTYYGFTCRDEDQYGLFGDFLLAETRWQQVYRVGKLGILWYEPAVITPGKPTESTRPHPGNTKWTATENYMEYDSDLWQYNNGSGGSLEWYLKDKERFPTKDSLGNVIPGDSPYAKALADRDAGKSTAFKAKFMGLSYLISRQYGVPGSSSTP